MSPDDLLQNLRDAVRHLEEGEGDAHYWQGCVVRNFTLLDTWLKAGGLMPADWRVVKVKK